MHITCPRLVRPKSSPRTLLAWANQASLFLLDEAKHLPSAKRSTLPQAVILTKPEGGLDSDIPHVLVILTHLQS